MCGVGGEGGCFLSLCGRGRPTDDEVAASLSGLVGEGADVSTDDLPAYRRVLPRLRVASHSVYPSDGSAGDGLGAVNALHKRLSDFLGPMNGVSTRWLPHYLAWFRFEEHVRRSGADVAAELASIAASGVYRTTRRELYGGGRPFWDYWEECLPVVDPASEWGADDAA